MTDRQRQTINDPAGPGDDGAGAQTAAAPPETTQPPATGPRRPRAAKAIPAGTSRLGIYLTPEQFQQAKAAYLADWSNGGQADTFGRWVGEAIATHAQRTVRERSKNGQPTGRSATQIGSSRSFVVPSESLEAMRTAINADQQAGRWLSDSAWCGEALDHAIDEARSRAGGTLPSPPPRLPNRLVR